MNIEPLLKQDDPPSITSLSTPLRSKKFTNIADEFFDVLIIGGGVTGAGIALDAASRGLKVLLVEKQDFAAGTSSRSTKLIHGGLRYLAQFEFKLVRDVASERKILFNNAPHLVIPEKMMLPFIKNGTYSKWPAAIGLLIYDLLGNVKKEERNINLNAHEAKKQEPLLDEKKLKGAGFYTEYRTDDARLTIEILKTATENYGAICINYTELNKFIYDENRQLKGAEITDILTGNKYELKARKIVNATGPWVDIIRGMDGEVKGKTLHHTKGVHIVVPYSKLPLKEAIYFDALGKRMIFAIPRDETTYIGTTDTNYTAQLEKPEVSAEDVDYLLNSVNIMFPAINIKKDDVISSWAGIRPLIHEEGKSPSEISRKDEIFVSDSGLISIAGGKLTGYRLMAEKVTDMLMKDFEKIAYKKFISCLTKEIKLGGSIGFETPDEWQKYYEKILTENNEFNKIELQKLLHKYGKNTGRILAFAKNINDDENKLLKAEIWYTINFEAVTNISDFLIRRTGMLFFRRPEIRNLLAVIENGFKEYLNTAPGLLEKQHADFINAYNNAVLFR